LLAPRPTPKVEYQPLSTVRQDLFNILATSTQYRKKNTFTAEVRRI